MDILSGPHVQKITNSYHFLLKPKSTKLSFINKEDLNHLQPVESFPQEEFFQDNYLIECNILQEGNEDSSSSEGSHYENPNLQPNPDSANSSPAHSHSTDTLETPGGRLSTASSMTSVSSLPSDDSATSLSSITVVVDMNRHVLAVDVSETSATDNIFMTVST